MNLYADIMAATDLKTTTLLHNLAKGCEGRSNMLLCNKLKELQALTEDVWNIAEICYEDEQRQGLLYAIKHNES